MLRVGLAGGPGSGKSAVAHRLQQLGARVSQSDEVARAMMQPGEAVFCAIVEHFGAPVLSPAGTLDRAALARLAFDEGRVEELNSIIHPAVIAAQSTWMQQVEQSDAAAVAVVESALMFETKHGQTDGAAPWRSRFDYLVVVTAPKGVRRERYIARATARSASADVAALAADFDARCAVQWSDERRSALADAVLPNDDSLQQLDDRVKHLYTTLRQLSLDRLAEAM